MNTLRELDGECSIIEDAGGLVRIEWSASPMLIWAENLHFHINLDQKYSDRGWSFSTYVEKLKDSETFLAETEDKLAAILPDGFECSVQWSDMSDDEYEDGDSPFLEFSVWKPDLNLPLDTLADDATDLMWPAIATLFNVTDPGTFNSPYLFSTLI